MIDLRRSKYLDLVVDGSISLFYSGRSKQKTGDQHFPFEVNRDFFYLTGIDQENVILAIVKGKTVNDAYLFIEKIDPIKALWEGETLSFEKASAISELKLSNVKDINTFDTFINQLLGASRAAMFGEINRLYFDLEKQKPSEFLSDIEIIANRFKKNYPAINISNSNRFLAKLRMIKDEKEISETKKAIEITKKALENVMKTLKSGIYEYEIEAEYNYILNKNAVSTSFNSIVAAGENGTILHYEDNSELVDDNDLVLLDVGVKYNKYASDISRTYPISGKFTERQKTIYQIVLDANKKTIEMLKPGITYREFNEFGKKVLIDGLKRIGLIKDDSEITKYYYHSLGHYLGLDVHDVGLYEELIPVGAIITVEPGLYIKEEKIGIRIEDDILITENGAINLSKDLIKEIVDIENFMKK